MRPSSATLPLRWPTPSHSSDGGDEQRGARGDRDLVERGAARGLGAASKANMASECIVI